MSELVQVRERTIDIQQPDRSRYHHVVKHLYARRQRWELAVSGLPWDPRAHARGHGCDVQDLAHGWRWNRVCEACRAYVLSDHDRFYLPAAVDAVGSGLDAGDHALVETRQGTRELFVGANAVQVLLRPPQDGRPQRFVTATRDPPSGRNPSNAAFHRKAVRKLRDKASLGSGDPA